MEVRQRGEAAGNGYLDQGLVGVLQQLARVGEPQLQVVARWRRLHVAPEQPFQVSAGDARVAGDLVDLDGVLDIAVHQLQGELMIVLDVDAVLAFGAERDSVQ